MAPSRGYLALFVVIGLGLPPLMAKWALNVAPVVQAEKSADHLLRKPLPDFQAYTSVKKKKQAFFDFLTPMVRHENERLLALRQRIAALDALPTEANTQQWLMQTSKRYRVTYSDDWPELKAKLLRRIDVIPASLVLAQAANESGWGSSRFARKANNLFGEWCFKRGCGLVPKQRADGLNHEVRKFKTVADSVVSYMRNLNSHPQYQSLRAIRATARAQNRPISGMELAEGLLGYSERGEAYIEEIRAMIRQNRLARLDQGTARG